MTEATEVVEVVITGPPDFIERHCRALVEDRLIACAQVARIESTYRWQGQVEKEPEARAALHAMKVNVNAIIERTRATHPYDVPCILVLPIQDADPDYVQWISDEASPSGSSSTHTSGSAASGERVSST